MMFRTLSLIVLLANAALGFAQSTAPAKLVVTDAFILTTAKDPREPVRRYLVVGEDGRSLTVAAGDPSAGLQARESLDAGGHWIIPGLISAHSHLSQKRVSRAGLGPDAIGMDRCAVQAAVKSSPEDMYWFTLDGALDHLQHGITAVYNFNFEAQTRGQNPQTANEYDQTRRVGALR